MRSGVPVLLSVLAASAQGLLLNDLIICRVAEDQSCHCQKFPLNDYWTHNVEMGGFRNKWSWSLRTLHGMLNVMPDLDLIDYLQKKQKRRIFTTDLRNAGAKLLLDFIFLFFVGLCSAEAEEDWPAEESRGGGRRRRRRSAGLHRADPV